MTARKELLPPPGGATSLVDRINLTLHARRYLKMVGRRWFVLAGCIVPFLSYSIYQALTLPNIYQVSTKVAVAPQVRQSGAVQGPVVVEEMNNFYDTQIDKIMSAAVQGRARQEFEKEHPLGSSSLTGAYASRGAGASIDLVVRATNFDLARNYAEIWRDEQIGNRLDAALVRHEERRKLLEDRLKDEMRRQDEFAEKHGIRGIQDTAKAARDRLDSFIKEARNLATQRTVLEGKSSDDLAIEASNRPVAPPQGQSITGAERGLFFESTYLKILSDLRSNQEQLARATNILKPAHPYVVEKLATIAKLNREREFELDRYERQRLAQIEELKSKEQTYQDLIKEMQAEVDSLKGLELEYSRFEQTIASLKADLSTTEESIRQFHLSHSGDEIFEAVPGVSGSPHPVEPNRPKIVMTGLLYGVALGIGLIYFLQRLDDRLEIAQDIEEELNEPVLGQIPQVQKRPEKGERLLITQMDQHEFFAESIRGIRSAIMFGPHKGSKQVMLVSSAVPGDGKTTFTVNFAATLALAGNRVLLVDADLRRGNAHHYFEHDREPGLSEVLVGAQHWSDVLKTTPIKTFDLLASGALPSNPGELLISPVTAQFIQEARAAYDYVVIDCPPLTAIDDAFSLVGHSDGLLFVVRAGQTSMRFAKNALAAVRQRGCTIFGIVLNGITADNPYYYYNSYYHAYYRNVKPATPTLNAAPAKRMAQPKNVARFASIEAEAKARAAQKGLETSKTPLNKTEIFRARRAALQQQKNTSNSTEGANTAPPAEHAVEHIPDPNPALAHNPKPNSDSEPSA